MRSLRLARIIAGAVVTVLTVAIVGALIVATTPIGCGPTKALGFKPVSNRCAKPVAATQSPSPTDWPAKPGYVPPTENPSPPPPYTPPAATPNPSDAYPPFTPPPSGSGPVTPQLSLTCRLPIYAGGSGSGGFLLFPGGNFVADPASGVSPPAGAPTPAPMMGGYGQGALSYDKAFSKWLPAPYGWVSPDGSRYVIPTSNGIWVQNVADSAHLLLGEGQMWAIVAFLSDGVYASLPNSAGLWLLPLSGSPRQVATTGYWRAAAAGAAYGTPTSAVPQGASSGIIKLDLKTGAITDWFSRPNAQAFVLGFDAQGHPIIQITYSSPNYSLETWLTTGPTAAVRLGGSIAPNNNYGQRPQLTSYALGDSNGIWFQASMQSPGPNNGMVLYVPGAAIYWMTNISGQLAGPCA